MTRAPDLDEYLTGQNREITVARAGAPLLGPLAQLPGTWVGNGRGWNMIALPFVAPEPPQLGYRLLLNHFNETLTFSLVDTGVMNRGLDATSQAQADQVVTALDYEQVVVQLAASDRPGSTVAGGPNATIHHEPGLFLNMLNETGDGPTIARLATIPHGDAVLALGTAFTVAGPPRIGEVDGLPVGVLQDVEGNGYLEPYRSFRDDPFLGAVPAGTPGFPGFDPTRPHALLEFANQLDPVASTTVLVLDTSADPGGIRNIPFVVEQANATRMRSTFWINEMVTPNADGSPRLQLQYLQVVILEFFPRQDGLPGRIEWPHVSINTMEKVSEEPLAPEGLTSAKVVADTGGPEQAAQLNTAR